MTLTGRHKACNQCRDRKIKCDGAQPVCRGCARNGHKCCYAPPAQRYSKADLAMMLEGINQRLLQAEASTTTAMSSELAFHHLGSSVHLPMTNADLSMMLDGTSAAAATPDFGFGFGSSYQPATTTTTTTTGSGASASAVMHGWNASSHAEAPAQPASFALPPVVLENGQQPVPLFGRDMLPFQLDTGAGAGSSMSMSPSQAGSGASESAASPFHHHSACPTWSGKRRRISTGQEGWWPCGNDKPYRQPSPDNNSFNNNDNIRTPDSRPDPAASNPQPEDSRPPTPASRTRSHYSADAPPAGSTQCAESACPPPTSPADCPAASPALNPCDSSMRRQIGNGASFQGLPVLTGPDQYDRWVRAVRAAARKEGVWDMMTGECERPSTPRPDASPESWRRHNDDMTYWLSKRELALGAIEGSLSEELQARIEGIECTREAWLTLERECKRPKQQALLEVIRELKGLSAETHEGLGGGGGGVAQLVERITKLRAEMACITTPLLQQLPEWYFALHFLVCLPTTYEGLVSSITSSGPLAVDFGSEGSLARVVKLAQAEERRLLIATRR